MPTRTEPLNPDDPTVRTAVFGKQVEQFLASDIGAYLTDCAKEQREQFLEKLKDVDPTDSEVILRYQMKVQIADCFLNWLGDALRAGLQSQEIISGVESD